jgi:hypothetical protein
VFDNRRAVGNFKRLTYSLSASHPFKFGSTERDLSDAGENAAYCSQALAIFSLYLHDREAETRLEAIRSELRRDPLESGI